MIGTLILKVPSKIWHRQHSKSFIYFIINIIFFPKKISLDISCHKKCEDLSSVGKKTIVVQAATMDPTVAAYTTDDLF